MAQEPIANFSPLTIARQPPRFLAQWRYAVMAGLWPQRLHSHPGGIAIIHSVNLLLQQTERHGETVNGGGPVCPRAAGDPNINGDNGAAAAPDAVEIVENTAADTARAVGNTDSMIGQTHTPEVQAYASPG